MLNLVKYVDTIKQDMKTCSTFLSGLLGRGQKKKGLWLHVCAAL